jgi:cytochrome c2
MRFSLWLLGALLTLPAGLLIGAGASQALGTGDPAHGKQIFAKCQACHSLDAGKNKVGPSLHGLIGRPSGTVESFAYSDAMKNAHLTWTPDVLDQYLTSPKKMVPGTKMTFPGLPKEQDRADVISYLQQAAGASQ